MYDYITKLSMSFLHIDKYKPANTSDAKPGE
jgi:hypothetical protein